MSAATASITCRKFSSTSIASSIPSDSCRKCPIRTFSAFRLRRILEIKAGFDALSSISTASPSRVNGVRKSCEMPASITDRFSDNCRKSDDILLNALARPAISSGPSTGRGEGRSPCPILCAADDSRFSGPTTLRVSKRLAIKVNSAPPKIARSRKTGGLVPSRALSKPRRNILPCAGTSTHIRGSLSDAIIDRLSPARRARDSRKNG